jgi:hypothetical protein
VLLREEHVARKKSPRPAWTPPRSIAGDARYFRDLLVQQLPDDTTLPRADRAKRLTECMQEFERTGLNPERICMVLHTGLYEMKGVRARSLGIAQLRDWNALVESRRTAIVRDLRVLTELLKDHPLRNPTDPHPPFHLVGARCLDAQTPEMLPRQLKAETAWREVEPLCREAEALAGRLEKLSDLLRPFHNSRGRIRQERPGNPERDVIGFIRRLLAEAGVRNREAQDELLELVGLRRTP